MEQNKQNGSELLRLLKEKLKLQEETGEREENMSPEAVQKYIEDIMSKTENGIYKCDNENLLTTKEKETYEIAQKYWSEVPATVNGMLGGFGYISNIDIEGSRIFLRQFKMKYTRALDCGAGIGRISKDLLLPLFSKVDLVEQDTAFANRAKEFCGEKYETRLGEIYNVGLQDFTPDPDTYDLIWCQWVLGYLTDDDLLKFFQRIREGLHKDGYFIMKDNVSSSNEVDVDETDSSVTRPLKSYENIIQKAGFKIVKIKLQPNLPRGLYPVYMIASQRIDESEELKT